VSLYVEVGKKNGGVKKATEAGIQTHSKYSIFFQFFTRKNWLRERIFKLLYVYIVIFLFDVNKSILGVVVELGAS
jgi:hypothetical protein